VNEKQLEPEAIQAAALAGDLRITLASLRRRMREQATTTDLTGSQLMVISHLESFGPATVTALARAQGVRPQSVGANVAALESAGLISGTADPDDGRQTMWSITPEASESFAMTRAIREDWLARAIDAKLTPAEQSTLAAAVTLLHKIVEP
jgi:DNA-binding MarR family transcriptional regulator